MKIIDKQFNELIDLLRQTSYLVRDAAMMTDSVFELMPPKKKVGRGCVCKIADDLGKAWDLFFKIDDLLQNVKKDSQMASVDKGESND